ncbi:MAG: hypothetical protein H0T89_07040 [Deltaproteobacteria bacterium]|nr:hypothetical protein [Deltaproteobacteria bacterium]MDQ3300945.1 hypothetical protein [Myxococcota bacterium]
MIKPMTLAALAVLSACGGDDPVSYSAPVGINLKAESGAVVGTALSDEKGITTESGNPYGAFVSGARAELGGDPGRIELDDLTLTLGGTSTGVTALEQVYAGTVDVLFVMGDTDNTYPVGQVVNPTGTGPVAVSVPFESNDVAEQDRAKFLGGGFKVVIRGAAAADFAAKGAKADLQLTFTFAAFE